MSETKAYVHELKTLMSGLENQIANDEHLISVLRAELESIKSELNYLRNENITLRSNA